MFKTIISLTFVFICLQSCINVTFAAKCQECLDYYGSCRRGGEEWVDDEVWKYNCLNNNQTKFQGCISSDRGGKQLIPANSNVTISGFWFSCLESETKLKYEQEPQCLRNGSSPALHVDDTFQDSVFQKVCKPTGIWVSGCFYKDEKGQQQLLSLGQSAYVGVVGHNCKEVALHPGRIQYWTFIKPNVTIATPSDRGHNNNLPENKTVLLTDNVIIPTFYNADYFIASNSYDVKIRYIIP